MRSGRVPEIVLIALPFLLKNVLLFVYVLRQVGHLSRQSSFFLFFGSQLFLQNGSS